MTHFARRQRRPDIRLCALLATSTILSGCSMQADPAAIAYVTIDPVDTQRLLDDLSAIARSQNLKSRTNKVSPVDRRTLYMFDGSGRALNIWAANMHLSGHECIEFPSPGSDPGQFQVVVRPAMWFPMWERTHVLFKAVQSDLEAKGYSLTSTPSAPCHPDRPEVWPAEQCIGGGPLYVDVSLEGAYGGGSLAGVRASGS
jgi:hypothetical protein